MRARLVGELGEDRPVRALATHFLAPFADRPLALHAVVERVGRDAVVCSLRAEQGGALVLVGSATFGASRSGPDHNGSPAPAVPGPDDCPPLALPRELAEFARQLEIRPATAARPLAGGERAELVAWMRFRDDRPLDAEAATVLTDALPPALFAIWTTPRPVPSAELTVHFGSALDDAPGAGWALVRIRAEHAGNGWAMDDAAVWSQAGRLLALGRANPTDSPATDLTTPSSRQLSPSAPESKEAIAMRDPVIVEAVRTPIGNGKPTGALGGVHPVDSISRDVRPALGADLTARYPQLRRYATPTTW